MERPEIREHVFLETPVIADTVLALRGRFACKRHASDSVWVDPIFNAVADQVGVGLRLATARRSKDCFDHGASHFNFACKGWVSIRGRLLRLQPLVLIVSPTTDHPAARKDAPPSFGNV